MAELRWALVGAGTAGRARARALLESPRDDLVAIWRGRYADDIGAPVVASFEAAIAAAEAGLGITRVLSYQVAESVAQGRLRIVLAEEEPAPWPVHILFRAGIVPRKLRAFVDFASPRLAEALSAHGARLAEAPVPGT